jgi:hypothetical protein
MMQLYIKAAVSHIRKAGTTRQPQAIRDKIARQLRSMADQIERGR